VDKKIEWGGQLFLSNKSSISGGVAILFTKNMTLVSYEFLKLKTVIFLKVIEKCELIVIFILFNIFMLLIVEWKEFCLKIFSKGLNTALFLGLGGDFNFTENEKNRPKSCTV